jgi:DNA-binding IclR family transcriptional regulator
MSRDHAALQLLRLGPLRYSEFVEITGWPRSSAYKVLARLCDAKLIRRTRFLRYEVWEAA